MFNVENHGSIVLIRPLTSDVHVWLIQNCGDEDTQWFGSALVVEPRYVEDIVHGLVEAGFALQ
jgi:hypothetical protein